MKEYRRICANISLKALDPCLGWEESEQLLYAIADSVK